MELWIVLFIMFGHWIADFVCQSNEMIMGKPINIWWLTNHVGAYSAFMVIWTASLIIGRSVFGDVMPPNVFLIIPIILSIFITHWITDFITSKIIFKLWEEIKLQKLIVIFGFDQWLHLVQLLIIYKVFLL